uniref:probable proline--tRNA ligase, mitochondrial n=1 Tax=Styela clava TaxID=7725 RepID=UPI00193A9B96|nr:probable proline--tRNA ligase, mitochondrial [Styela clava]
MRLTFSMQRHKVSKYMIGGVLDKDASIVSTCKSHRLMLHAQLISSSGTGSYNILPMGLRALDKLYKIIDNEMLNIGCLKMSLSSLCSAALWKKSKRWEAFGDELVKLKMSNTEYCLNPTHEEVVTNMVASTGLIPAKNLPMKLYQITSKFRDEPRPRFGLLRCREFLMKDLYTFDKDTESAMETYELVTQAYERILKTLELKYIRAASSCGNMGGKLSHEYLIPADIGEDKIYVSEDGDAWNAEYDDSLALKISQTTEIQAIEIGHTFLLGQLYSQIFGANLISPDSKRLPLQMGCYGLGVTRILAGCVEHFSNDDSIRWPYAISPFKVCIIPPKQGSKEQKYFQNMDIDLYKEMEENPLLEGDVIIDDRDNYTIGKRLHDAKFIGYPVVLIIGKHILDEHSKVEVLLQNKNESISLPLSEVVPVIIKEFEEDSY